MTVCRRVVVAVVCFLCVAGLGQASAITSKTDTALDGAFLIDFECFETGSFTSITADNVTFTTTVGGQVGYISTAYSGGYGAVGQSLQNTYNSNAFGTLRMDFATAVSAFAFNWGASDTQWTLTAYDASDNVIESICTPPEGLVYYPSTFHIGIRRNPAAAKGQLWVECSVARELIGVKRCL
ncbi:MAG: hypothetical protein HY236_03365 [Acidobacteria bacterium]|nr:hypothetical protein [Acidobacteriota bacterium]